MWIRTYNDHFLYVPTGAFIKIVPKQKMLSDTNVSGFEVQYINPHGKPHVLESFDKEDQALNYIIKLTKENLKEKETK